LPQFILGFAAVRIQRDAIYGTDLLALRLIEMAHALRALAGIDDIDLVALGNGTVGALGFADITIDTFIGDD